ncbi:MAG: MBL fold metallo-hydrolase [Williamsia sp.]|nr:MBL fold metallo-hydrolase [Williamsia sp.]
MKIITLSEGAFTIDKTKLFVPFDTGADDLQSRPVGSLLVEIQPFLIVTTEDVLLLDAGLGFEQEGKLQIHRNLAAQGLQPTDVTKVLMTHLHKDHAGGVGYPAKTGSKELAFPNATYYVQDAELKFAFEKGLPSYIPEELICLQDSPQVQLLHGDGVIDGYIRYKITGGHCPYHQVFWIVDGGEKVLFGGDVAPQLQQMRSRFMAKYDYDGKKCMELRQEWWKQGEEEKWTFLFYHDIKAPVYSFQ